MQNDTEVLEIGTTTQRGFVNDNVLHASVGDIHFSSYIPRYPMTGVKALRYL